METQELVKSTPKGIKTILEQKSVKDKFESLLGKKSVGFLVSIINTVQNNDLLAKADTNSILFAAANAAILDLPINPNLGFAYIVPYNKKGKDGQYIQVAQFQMGYKGFIQLAQRSGQFKTISATAIYEGQLVEENPLTGFVFDFTKKQSDKVIGYAAYMSLLNGFEKTIYMNVADVTKHGVKYSQTFKKNYGLWATDFDAMALKTLIKLLLSKYAPLSIEMQKAVITDQGVLNGWEDPKVAYPDNQPVVPLDSNEASKIKANERVMWHIEKSNTMEELVQVEEYLTTPEQKKAYAERKSILTTSKN